MNPQQPIFLNLTFWNLFLAFATVLVGWLLVRYEARLFSAVAENYPRSRFMAKMVEPIVRVLIWFTATLIIIQILAPTKDAFLAMLGSAAIAIGLGAQDLIKNLIGGIVILAVRPFQVGDRVQIGEAYGEIVRIGLQTTQLVTPSDSRVTIPNATLLNSISSNANSGVPACLVTTEVFLPAEADSDLALQLGRRAVLSSPFLNLSLPVFVVIEDAFVESPFQRLKIKGYVYDHRYEPAMQSDVTRRIKREFLSRGLLDAWR